VTKIEEQLIGNGPGWLFIVGVNNSGTTLLRSILARHPQVRTLRENGKDVEGHHLAGRTGNLPVPTPMLGRLWSERKDLFCMDETTTGWDAQKVIADWAPCFTPGNGYLMEKSPPNTLRTRWLQAHFKPSHFVVIVRNGYAVAEGIVRRRSVSAVKAARNVSLQRAARHWAISNEILLNDLKHIKNQVMVRYEDWVLEPRKEMARITDFLKIDPVDPSILDKKLPVHNVTGRQSTIRDFNELSFKRLKPAQRRAIETEAGYMLKRLGYWK
jgi:hypothetical protein